MHFSARLSICIMLVNICTLDCMAYDFNYLMVCVHLLVALTGPEQCLAGRYFAKFWSFSLIAQPNGTNVGTITMVMPRRAECVSLCVHTANCCCTQWVPSNSTCTVLVADRAGLEPNPLALSSIDSMYLINKRVLYTIQVRVFPLYNKV